MNENASGETYQSAINEIMRREAAGPEWFTRAIACEPRREWLEVDGARIEYCDWGGQGRPLLLTHGNGAHAASWAYLAPLLTRRYRVAGISFSGHGGSDRRDEYRVEHFVAEMEAAAARLRHDGTGSVVAVSHSMGGHIAAQAALLNPHGWGGVIIVDAGPMDEEHMARLREEGGRRPAPAQVVHPDAATILARFRLGPQQACRNDHILAFLAREAVCPCPGGWTWRRDAAVSPTLAMDEGFARFSQTQVPLAQIYGDRSAVVTPDVLALFVALAPPGTPVTQIIDAGHHVMCDEPLALIAAVETLLAAGWAKD